jgi:hypothetical protein
MDVQRNSQNGHRTHYVRAISGFGLLACLLGCGVRSSPQVRETPLPICGNGHEVCQTISQDEQSNAPGWLIRCRLNWARWRNGEGTSHREEGVVIPPPPRFHPVPTRPVFSPLPTELPAGATHLKSPAAPIPPAKNQFPADLSPDSAPVEEVPAPRTSDTSSEAADTPEPISPERAALAPKYLPRALLPRVSTPAASKPKTISSNPDFIESKVPDAPQATEPLADAPLKTDWKPRR